LKCTRENSEEGLKRRGIDSGKYKEGTIVEIIHRKRPRKENLIISLLDLFLVC